LMVEGFFIVIDDERVFLGIGFGVTSFSMVYRGILVL
jgi:hypothetical protein